MQNVVLIGPTGSGKTAVAPALAEALGLPWLELDDLRWDYYSEIGYSEEQAEQAQRDRGVDGRLEYWKPFELHSVQRLLEDHPDDHVLAFGFLQGNEHLLALPDRTPIVAFAMDDERRAARALARSQVVLLLPSEDTEASIRILLSRIRVAAPELPDSMMASVESFTRQQFASTSNRRLANHVVYNADQAVADTVQAILSALQ